MTRTSEKSISRLDNGACVVRGDSDAFVSVVASLVLASIDM